MKDILFNQLDDQSFLSPCLIKYTCKNEAEAGLRKLTILQFQDFKYFKIKTCIDKIYIP